MLDRLAFRHLQAFHNRLQTLASENPQQGIVEREIEARGARITLTTGTTTQLVVDPPRFVPLRTDNVQAAGSNHLIVQDLPVGADGGNTRLLVSLVDCFIVTQR